MIFSSAWLWKKLYHLNLVCLRYINILISIKLILIYQSVLIYIDSEIIIIKMINLYQFKMDNYIL